MKTIGILSGVLVLALMVAVLPADEQPADPLTVRIVPMRYHEDGERQITLYMPGHHFYAVVTNVSDKPVRLWRQWCSWGNENLSFQVTDQQGRTTSATRRPRAYGKNYPDWTTVPPGGHMVCEVTFDPDVWENPPLPEKHKSHKVKLKAVYRITGDDQATQHGVWTGEVSSPELDYTIYR
jgi:hypothetical protein